MMILTLAGCSSKGLQSSSGVPDADVFETFKRGDARLECGLACSGAWGANQLEAKKLYDQESWKPLFDMVAKIGYNSDITYFFLGNAAEGLGYAHAAEKYYDLALSADFPCQTFFFDNCMGLVLPRDILTKLEALRIGKPDEKVIAALVQPSDLKPNRSDSYVAPENEASDLPESSEPVASIPLAKKEALSEEVSQVTPFVPAEDQAKIGSHGYPEIFLPEENLLAIQSRLRGILFKEGWLISSEANGALTASRQMDAARAAGRAFSARFLRGETGNNYSDAISFLLEEQQNGVVAIARPLVIKVTPRGRETVSEQQEEELINKTLTLLNKLSAVD